MKKTAKGFTLVELMIVVAIIGILAAIAIPNFLRYQLRSKLSELKTNVEAIYKSEMSLRQSERKLCAAAPTGAFANITITPVQTAGPNAQKIVWAPGDYALASAIDWSVQGATYGQYQASTGNAVTGACTAPVIAAFGYSLAVSSISDIDGDSTTAAGAGHATIGLWQPLRDAAGAIVGTEPVLPLLGDVTLCTGGAHSAAPSIGDGQATNCSADNIF